MVLRALSDWANRLLIRLVDEISLSKLIITFVVVVVIFGWIYSALSTYGQGIVSDRSTSSATTLLDGIYFSVVTVSSLGYGDLRPIGVARIFACIEVLFGLAILGIVIAKITSRRLSYHVQRLFSADAQRRLDEHIGTFQLLSSMLQKVSGELSLSYQKTPGSGAIGDPGQSAIGLKSTLVTLHSRCVTVCDYFLLEAQDVGYFRLVSAESICRVGDAANDVFFRLSQLVISLPPDARMAVLDVNCRELISRSLDKQKQVCEVVRTKAKDDSVVGTFARLAATCDGFPAAYITVPSYAGAGQPDQTPVASNMPQG